MIRIPRGAPKAQVKAIKQEKLLDLVLAVSVFDWQRALMKLSASAGSAQPSREGGRPRTPATSGRSGEIFAAPAASLH
jgi:hypothetical protein